MSGHAVTDNFISELIKKKKKNTPIYKNIFITVGHISLLCTEVILIDYINILKNIKYTDNETAPVRRG